VVKKIDMIGNKFGRLIVLSESPTHQAKKVMWNCKCECGTLTTVDGTALRSGNTRSCGCHRSDMAALKARTHGASRSPTYRIWESMKKRCFDKSNKDYPSYGGRGISVCALWLNFENFIKDMGERPEGYSIDRIDNSKGYEPGNCRWATSLQQNRNRRNNKIITLNGIGKTQSEWAADIGISDATIHKRLKRGWSISDALTKGE
jgi:hypothetical protein